MAKRERAKRPLSELLKAARKNRYKVIHERNLLILALAKHAGFDAHLVAIDDPGEWTKAVCVHTPAGQLHWRLSPEDQEDFRSLKTIRKSDYDGAKAAEKVARLERLHTLPRTVDAVDPVAGVDTN